MGEHDIGILVVGRQLGNVPLSALVYPDLERGYGRSTWLRRDRQCHGHWVSMWFVVVGFAQDFLGVVVSIDAWLAMVQVGRR